MTMQSTNNNLSHIFIPLTPEEEDLEKSIHQKNNVELTVPSGFQKDTVWELANLTRIAYKDYEIFNESSPITGQQRPNLLYPGSILYTSSNMCIDRIDDYFIEQNPQQEILTDIVNTYDDDRGMRSAQAPSFYGGVPLTSFNIKF